MAKKPPKRDPIIVYKREDKGLKPFLPRERGFRFGKVSPQKQQPKPRKPKEEKTVLPEKVKQHRRNLEEIEAMPSPEREVARACYFLCFLVHETKVTTELFPLKHNVLEKIFKGAYPFVTVSFVERGDKEIYHLSHEAKKRWESETGGDKHHIRMYLTPKCKVEFEKGYYDLYYFHIVIEPFRFAFYLPTYQAQWLDKRRLSKRRFRYPQTVEYGLVRGKVITSSRKSTMVPLEEVKAELQAFVETEIPAGK
jgi:hypothetical protein